MKGWKNKLRSVIKGPSWIPGLSWTGHDGRRASVMNNHLNSSSIKLQLKPSDLGCRTQKKIRCEDIVCT